MLLTKSPRDLGTYVSIQNGGQFVIVNTFAFLAFLPKSVVMFSVQLRWCTNKPSIMECTPKCRLTKHADLVLSVITKEDAASIRAILPRICSNFARVSDQFGRNALHLAASCGKGDILEWLVKDQALDVGSKDLESGWTALHRSLFYGYLDSAVKLIQVHTCNSVI